MKKSVKRLTLYAILISIALALSVAEGAITAAFMPLPGVKLGLANIITLFALYFIGLPGAAVILILRCLLASLFGGGVVALMMSLSGGLLALFTMALTRRMRGVTLIGVSVAGAAMHGVGQIAAAMLILSNSGVIFYLPILLISGVFTGAIIGVVATFLFARLRRVSSVINYFGD